METRIWKNPAESASPPARLRRLDSCSAAITGSSGGSPARRAAAPIQAAMSARSASSPGYGTASPEETSAASLASAPWCGACEAASGAATRPAPVRAAGGGPAPTVGRLATGCDGTWAARPAAGGTPAGAPPGGDPPGGPGHPRGGPPRPHPAGPPPPGGGDRGGGRAPRRAGQRAPHRVGRLLVEWLRSPPDGVQQSHALHRRGHQHAGQAGARLAQLERVHARVVAQAGGDLDHAVAL